MKIDAHHHLWDLDAVHPSTPGTANSSVRAFLQPASRPFESPDDAQAIWARPD